MAREERILYVTPGYRLIALNAKTGARVPAFGKNGVVDLKQNDDQEIDPITGEVGLHATPVVAKNVVIVGAAHQTGGVPQEQDQREGLRPRLRRAHRQAPLDLPHHPQARRIRLSTPGRRIPGRTPATPACGDRSASTKSSDWRICRSNCPPATTTAATAPATACSAKASSRSI